MLEAAKGHQCLELHRRQRGKWQSEQIGVAKRLQPDQRPSRTGDLTELADEQLRSPDVPCGVEPQRARRTARKHRESEGPGLGVGRQQPVRTQPCSCNGLEHEVRPHMGMGDQRVLNALRCDLSRLCAVFHAEGTARTQAELASFRASALWTVRLTDFKYAG
jgi:hypothetical protein